MWKLCYIQSLGSVSFCISPPSLVYSFARAVLTKSHKLGVLSNRNVLSYNSGAWTSKVKGLKELAPEDYG